VAFGSGAAAGMLGYEQQIQLGVEPDGLGGVDTPAQVSRLVPLSTGMVVVVEPQRLEVLAQASRPLQDNLYGDACPACWGQHHYGLPCCEAWLFANHRLTSSPERAYWASHRRPSRCVKIPGPASGMSWCSVVWEEGLVGMAYMLARLKSHWW
jgi:hypothetical protein